MFVINIASCDDDDVSDLYVGIERDENGKVLTFDDVEHAKAYCLKLAQTIKEVEEDDDDDDVVLLEWEKDDRGWIINMLMYGCTWYEFRIEEI